MVSERNKTLDLIASIKTVLYQK